MDVNVAAIGVDVSTAVKSRFEAFEPKDTVHDCCIWLPAPLQAHRLSGAKDGPNWIATANLGSHPVQADGRLIRVFYLTCAERRAGNDKAPSQCVMAIVRGAFPDRKSTRLNSSHQ